MGDLNHRKDIWKAFPGASTTRMTKFWLMAFLATCHGVWPQPALAEVDESLAIHLMHESGFTDALSAVPREFSRRILSNVMDVPGPGSDPVLGPAVARAVDAAFSRSLTEATISVFRNGLDATTVAELRKWSATPLGERLLRTQQGIAAYEFTSLMDRRLPMLKIDDSKRLQVLEQIVDASRIEYILSDTWVVFGLAATRAGDLAYGNERTPMSDKRAGEIQLDSSVRVLVRYFDVLLPQYAALYSEFSTDELQQYADYLTTPAARKWNYLRQSAVRKLLRAQDADLASRLDAIARPCSPLELCRVE